MTEAFMLIPEPKTRESRAMYWKEKNPQEVRTMVDTARKMGLVLFDAGFRGGGILEPAGGGNIVPENQQHFSENTWKAIVLARTEGSSDHNVALHYPTHPEGDRRQDSNFYVYHAHVGDYLKMRWNPELGHNPLPGVVGHEKLPDGRHATAIRFRKNYEMLGANGFETGAHLMDTTRITPQELRKLVRVLDALHVPTEAFQEWAAKYADIPRESWINRENPGFAFRGKEWWISPSGDMDRMTELTANARKNEQLYRDIDASSDVPGAIGRMITNNIELYPHQDGRVDNPALAGDLVLIHGSVHPDNIHIKRYPDTGINFTVTGGDRAQGAGLRGQMIDWLVTSAVNSPEHQNALIQEFLKLHPSEKDRRGLAMHVMYRSVLETSWFAAHNKPEEAKKLAQLTYDIVNGNGVWKGVNLPLTS